MGEEGGLVESCFLDQMDLTPLTVDRVGVEVGSPDLRMLGPADAHESESTCLQLPSSQVRFSKQQISDGKYEEDLERTLAADEILHRLIPVLVAQHFMHLLHDTGI